MHWNKGITGIIIVLLLLLAIAGCNSTDKNQKAIVEDLKSLSIVAAADVLVSGQEVKVGVELADDTDMSLAVKELKPYAAKIKKNYYPDKNVVIELRMNGETMGYLHDTPSE